MSPPDPRDQLDAPLVWADEPEAAGRRALRRSEPSPSRRIYGSGSVRIVGAALADLGMVVLTFAVTWIVAAVQVQRLGPFALLLVVLASLEVASVAFAAWLWGFRGTPGMLLLDVCFASPLGPGRALRVWLFWLVALPLAGVPLLVGRKGRRILERVAGAALSPRSTPSGA